MFGKFAAVNSGTIPFQAYRAVSSSRSKYIEHTNALRERDEGQKSNLWSRKGELSSSLFFPRVHEDLEQISGLFNQALALSKSLSELREWE